MSIFLLTGASGFLGSRILEVLSARHHVITIGRKPLPAAVNQTHYIGNFAEFEDLRQMDAHAIDAVIHLAAVTGGCLEREGILVNVEGTRCLMRYLIDRDCRKFVNASSTAVVGFQSKDFRPTELPIGDEHSCLDRDGYGVSKYLMEELTRYLCLQNPEIDVINLRLAAIYPDDSPPAKVKPGAVSEWAVGQITQLSRSEAVRAFELSVEAEMQAGCRIFNVVSPKAWVEGCTADVLRAWWGDEVDLSYFEGEAVCSQASLYNYETIRDALGFIAK